jgi:enoyl-CoA hydratase
MSVRIEKPDKHIVVITIDRPEVRNAVDKATARQLADAFRDFDKDPEVSRKKQYAHGSSCPSRS